MGWPPEAAARFGHWRRHCVVSSAILLDELAGVLERERFVAALASRDLTPAFLTRQYGTVTTLIRPMPVDRPVPADPDDDHVIEAALGARADAIATGDRHLLELDPYRGIRILAPAAAMELVHSREGGTDA